ncbi:glycoside hydrolase family 13 protein [Segatella oris]|uniref:glycoside hydrolase family 13 protein n=1 Tax=Segatella oris TaxID=28135 RepID=UPI0028F0F61C|nr:glycoside hydrolase family 13 protein [Segatella oris]
MKKIIFSLALFLSAMTSLASTNIDRIEPANWFVGMKNSSLQLMVYGKNIRNSRVSVDYPGVKIDSLVRLDSPDYLLVYLNVGGAKPGEMMLNFNGKKVKYPLQAREMSGDKRMGFTNSDVLYMLMPDRFASGRGITKPLKGMNPYVVDRSKPSLRHGGDLEGIRRHLDYFNQLGVTALWFTPILENDAPDINDYNNYHGYDTTDYYRVDPRFGTNEDYRRLIAEAHAKGLKVVMDMIFNHCGFDHPWVKNMPSKDWFNAPEWLKEGEKVYLQTSYKLTPVLDPYASEVDKRETVDGWFVKTKPDLNQRNPHVMTYLVQNSIWWIETVGIDGIRMDTYPYADRKAMSQWMKAFDEEYPNFNTVGEIWVTEPAYTAAWQKDSRLSSINSYLKTVMDFSFYDKINLAKSEETDDWWKGLNRIYNSLCYDYLYENPSSVMAFIENHDTDRFLGEGKDTLALKQALGLLLTINRIPQLYYGTEVLMNGTKTVTDGDVRRDFPGGFAGDKHNAFTAEGRTKEENAMFNWLSRLLHWRQGNEVVSKGKQIQFIPYKGVYVVARQYQGKTVLTILNGKRAAVEMDLSRYAEVIGNQTEARDVVTGKTVKLGDVLRLKPRETMIIEMSSNHS